MPKSFDDATVEAIASSLRAGQYNLLLGAGVSLDSSNTKGDLPSGETFRQDLCKLKGANSRSSLQRVYSSLSKAEIDEHVIERFSACKAGQTVQKIKDFVWKRIFTFNIDDALEAAYASGGLQNAMPHHFDDTFVEMESACDVPIIHLHGWVGHPDREFVFALSEYVRQIKNINAWMVVLTQQLRSDPFIIAGTALEEVDLEFYLAHRSSATSRKDRGPSILVEPFPDAVTIKDCEKYDLLLFEGTAVEFFDYIDARAPNRPRPVDLVPQTTRKLFPEKTPERTLVAFSADFELVPASATPTIDTPRFLYGYPPSWSDLAAQIDIGRSLTSEIIKEVEKRFNEPLPVDRLILLLEETGAGKTTVLRRVAFDLAQRGFHVLTCSSLSRIDPQFTADAIDMIDVPVVILVDNFADQASSISEVIDRIEKKDIVFVCAERDYRGQYIRRIVSSTAIDTCDGLSLTSQEAQALISLYTKHGLLGDHNALKNTKEFIGKLTKEPAAIACCSILNDFRPLDRIIDSLYKEARSPDRKRYLAAALAQHCFRGGVRYEVLSVVSGREGWDGQVDAIHPLPLSYVGGSDRSFIAPANAALAFRLLNRVARDDAEAILDIFVEIALALAPRVNRDAIRRRSPDARLASRLFDYDQIVEPLLKDLASDFYVRTHDLWLWNSRYWEQIALLHLAKYRETPNSEEGRDNLAMAVRHARHAVSIEHHPLPLTTLGKILLAQMSAPGISRTAAFEEAFLRLTEAIRIEKSLSRVTLHPFVTLFRGVRDFINGGGILTGRQADELRNLTYEAKNRIGRDREVQEVIAAILPLLG